jgi:hypothetical protein
MSTVRSAAIIIGLGRVVVGCSPIIVYRRLGLIAGRLRLIALIGLLEIALGRRRRGCNIGSRGRNKELLADANGVRIRNTIRSGNGINRGIILKRN